MKDVLRLSLFFSLAVIYISCTPKDPRHPASDGIQAEGDSIPPDSSHVKLMPDTLLTVSESDPLLIADHENTDSVMIFPYTLLFKADGFACFIVSYSDYSPTLVTLDDKQQIIDSITLFTRLRTTARNFRQVRRARIASLASITLTDSIYDIASHKAVSARRVRYRVNQHAKFEVVDP